MLEKKKETLLFSKVLIRLLVSRLFIPLMILFFIVLTGVGYTTEKAIEKQQQQVVRSVALVVDKYLEQGGKILSVISKVADTASIDDLQEYMKSTWLAYGFFETMYYLDNNQKIVMLVPSDSNYLGFDMSNFSDFKNINNSNKLSISRPFISIRTGDPTVYLILPVKKGGTLVGELNLSVLQKEIENYFNSYKGNEIFIMDQNGMLLAHKNAEFVEQQTNFSNLEIFQNKKAVNSTIIYSYLGKKELASVSMIKQVGWTVVSQIGLVEMFSPYILTLLITLALSLIILFMLIWNFRKHLHWNVVDPLYSNFSRENEGRKNAEVAWHQSELRFKALFEQSMQLTAILDLEGKIIDVNNAALQFKGLNAEEVKGKYFWETPWWNYSEEMQNRIKTEVQKSANGEQTRFEAIHYDLKMEINYIDTSIKPAVDEKGNVVMLIVEGRDITELIKAEEALKNMNEELEIRVEERTRQLEVQKEKAEAANHAKGQFLAYMSHELRTPLNAILGYSELLCIEKELPQTALESLRIINSSGLNLLTLINDILDLSKIEAGKMTLTFNEINMHQFLKNIVDMFKLKADSKGIELILEIKENIPKYTYIDEIKLRQVLINLIGNAVKFTQQGKVSLFVDFIEKENNGKRLAFAVMDTGMGIEKDEVDHLFEAFVQTKSGKKTGEGTGLGLSIAQKFVNLMGGNIKVASMPGSGTVFKFDIPVGDREGEL